MARAHAAIRWTLALAGPALIAQVAVATTLMRQGLDRLAIDNDVVVDGTVLDLHSYWNPRHTFILTDVRVRPLRTLKGVVDGNALTFTVPGGTVGEVTVLLVGGPNLLPGSEYVVFLKRSDLPGAPHCLTVRDLGQGVFDVDRGRAVSQASGEPLLPDAAGRTDVAGGEDGIPLADLVQRVREALAPRDGIGREP